MKKTQTITNVYTKKARRDSNIGMLIFFVIVLTMLLVAAQSCNHSAYAQEIPDSAEEALTAEFMALDILTDFLTTLGGTFVPRLKIESVKINQEFVTEQQKAKMSKISSIWKTKPENLGGLPLVYGAILSANGSTLDIFLLSVGGQDSPVTRETNAGQ